MSSVNVSESLAKNSTSVPSVPSESDAEIFPFRGPQMALRSDGALLLSIEDIPPHVNLDDREKWTAIVVRGAEADLVRSRLANAEADMAARLVMIIASKQGS